MLPVLVASSRGEVRIGQVVDELATQLELSQEDRSDLLPSGKQTVFSNRVHWAKSYLKQGAACRDFEIAESAWGVLVVTPQEALKQMRRTDEKE